MTSHNGRINHLIIPPFADQRSTNLVRNTFGKWVFGIKIVAVTCESQFKYKRRNEKKIFCDKLSLSNPHKIQRFLGLGIFVFETQISTSTHPR